MAATNGSLLTDEQIPLACSLKAVHLSNGKRWRDLLCRALVANGVSQGTIARETEREPSTITRMLKGEQGATDDVVAAILAHDTLGTVITGFAGMVGWEAKRVQADPARENAKLREELGRIRAELDRLLDGSQS